ncbi:hypothetical protein GCM10027589_14520 [Actinocorallia lasiicapitis]
MALIRRMAIAMICAVLVVAGVSGAAAPDVVSVETGDVRGVTAAGHRSYLGIPYAKAPVGELRWRPPQPPAAWDGVRDATRFGASCAQPASPFNELALTEDCLFLNVFAPKTAGRLPVIVWLHGGANLFLDGSTDAGTFAERAGAVVVTLNHRLGVPGLLALPALRAENPALNYEIQDQQAALRWVQRNVSAFGGDRTRVTLMGESGGGIAACVHVGSPASAGLFHRVILQSNEVCGREQSFGVPRAKAEQTGEGLATKVGCPSGPDQLTCLRTKPIADLVAAAAFVAGPEPEFVFSPIVDGVVLPAPPVAMMKSGRVPKVPVLTGYNADEGYLFAAFAWKVYDGTVPPRPTTGPWSPNGRAPTPPR